MAEVFLQGNADDMSVMCCKPAWKESGPDMEVHRVVYKPRFVGKALGHDSEDVLVSISDKRHCFDGISDQDRAISSER